MNSYIYTVETAPAELSELVPTIMWRQQGSYVISDEGPWTLKQVETASLPNPLGPPEVLLRLTFANGTSVTASAAPNEADLEPTARRAKSD